MKNLITIALLALLPLAGIAQTPTPKKFTDLPAADDLADDDIFPMVDVSQGRDEKMSGLQLKAALGLDEGSFYNITDPNADSLLWWNDTANAVQTTALSAFATLTGTQTLTNKTLTAPTITGGTVETATGGDNDTSPASTAFVQSTARGSQTGVHATPSTTNPLAPTWTSIMHVVWYGATGEIDLPAASGYAGRGILIYNTGAFTITIDPNGSEVIVRAGTVQTGGVSITLSSGAGNYVALISDGARWSTLGSVGTVSAGS